MIVEIPILSDGSPSTLKTYRGYAKLLFPKALPFLDRKIAEEAKGEEAVVLTDESQMLQLLASF